MTLEVIARWCFIVMCLPVVAFHSFLELCVCVCVYVYVCTHLCFMCMCVCGPW